MLKIDVEGITAEELLQMALLGLEQVHKQQTQRISDLKARLAGSPAVSAPAEAAEAAPKRRSRLSPAARANIIAAQKRRWSRVKKEQKQAAKLAAEKAAAKLAARASKKGPKQMAAAVTQDTAVA